jgi:hypothetical protein
MKKALLLLTGVLFLSTSVFAGVVPNSRGEQPTGSKFQSDLLDGETLTVNATGSATTNAFRIRQGQVRSLQYQFTSATGTPDVMIEYLVSDASDGTFVEPDNVSDLATSIADENLHFKAFTPVVAGWGKIKITGNAANPADTVVAELKMNEAAQY